MHNHINELLALISNAAPHKPVFEVPKENIYDHPMRNNENDSGVDWADNARSIHEAEDALAATSRELESEFSGAQNLTADDKQRQQARTLLQRLVVNRYVELFYGLDYALEVRRIESLARADCNPAVYLALISIAGYNDKLNRDIHGSGYHFHYVSRKSKKYVRTNALFTFDPTERVGPPDSLYWERHGNYLSVNPGNWGIDRCRAIYSAARPSINNPGKAGFRKPSNDAQVLWNQ